MNPGAGSVALRWRMQSTFYVTVRPWPHLGIFTWVPSFWIRTILRNSLEVPVTVHREQIVKTEKTNKIQQ
jgi:hypothetical protein